ncbi:MAG: hypothetical protein WAM13_20525 [Candidatus Sulfotelmatobacter sp.]
MGQTGEVKKVWVTLSGLPLTISLEWPFHRSTSGADFWVLHGDIRLENSDGLHAPVAVNLSATVREVVASLEPVDVEAPVINALRKEVDHRQIEFVKSGKLKPVAFSSRHYDFKRGKWVFGKATDEVIAEFLERKVYWGTKLSTGRDDASVEGGGDGSETKIPRVARNDKPVGKDVWIGDPTDAQYLETTPAHLMEIAGRLAGDGLLVRMEGEQAEATDGLMARAEQFEDAMRSAVETLEKKHAFERG